MATKRELAKVWLILFILLCSQSFANEEIPREALQAIRSGYDFYSRGGFEKAIDEYARALTLAPGCWRARFWLAKSHYRAGRIRECIKILLDARFDTLDSTQQSEFRRLFAAAACKVEDLPFEGKVSFVDLLRIPGENVSRDVFSIRQNKNEEYWLGQKDGVICVSPDGEIRKLKVPRLGFPYSLQAPLQGFMPIEKGGVSDFFEHDGNVDLLAWEGRLPAESSLDTGFIMLRLCKDRIVPAATFPSFSTYTGSFQILENLATKDRIWFFTRREYLPDVRRPSQSIPVYEVFFYEKKTEGFFASHLKKEKANIYRFRREDGAVRWNILIRDPEKEEYHLLDERWHSGLRPGEGRKILKVKSPLPCSEVVDGIFDGSDQKVWIRGKKEGWFFFDSAGWKRGEPDPNKETIVSRHLATCRIKWKFPLRESIRCVFLDSRQDTWLGTKYFGLWRYAQAQFEYVPLCGMVPQIVRRISEQDGNLFICTTDGVFCITRSHAECITTIQRLYSMLMGEPEFDAELEEQSLFDISPRDKQPREIFYNPQIPIETFDLIASSRNSYNPLYEKGGAVKVYKLFGQDLNKIMEGILDE